MTSIVTKKSVANIVVKKGDQLTLNGLKNVNIDNPTNNDVLAFDSIKGKWVSKPVIGGIEPSANVVDGGNYGDIAESVVDGGDY